MSGQNPSDRPKPSKGDHQRAKELEVKCWELREKGYSVRYIGKQLGVSHVAVFRALERTERRLNEQIDRIALGVLARDLAQLEHVQAEAMLAWERSQRPGRKLTRKGKDDPTVEATQRDGDARFLAQALAAIESRRKLVVDRDVLERLDELEAKFDGDGGGARPAEASRADRSGGT